MKKRQESTRKKQTLTKRAQRRRLQKQKALEKRKAHRNYSTRAGKKKHNKPVSQIPEQGNYYIDKHYSDDNHIKRVVFGEDYDEILDSSDEEANYNELTKILNDTDRSIEIQEDTEESYDQFVKEYKILKECKYMLHTIQFKQGLYLNKVTKMALREENGIEHYEDMIASHHYYVSTNKNVRTNANFGKTFFELSENYMKQFLKEIKETWDNDVITRQKRKGPIKQERDEMKELRKMYNHLTQNSNPMFVNQWCKIADLAMPLWQKKLRNDEQIIQDRFAIPVAIKYFEGVKQPRTRKAYCVKFSFLTMNDESKCWYKTLDWYELKTYGQDIENTAKYACENPGKLIHLSHEATSKTNITGNHIMDIDAPPMLYYQGKRSKCLTYSLAGAIKYLLMKKEIFGIDYVLNHLKEIKQQDSKIMSEVNAIMGQANFECKKLKKRKRKRKNIDLPAICTDILDESVVRIKNVIYVCSLMTSMGDNLHTVSIVNDWIFDSNFTNAISFGKTGLDHCCKHNSERVKYKTCKQIWLYTPSNKIKSKK